MTERPRTGPAPSEAAGPASATHPPTVSDRLHVAQVGAAGAVRWCVAADANPVVRRWGGEVVVHHALSNDTYRLTPQAGDVLTALMAAGGPLDGGPVDARDAACLLALADLGLVTRC